MADRDLQHCDPASSLRSSPRLHGPRPSVCLHVLILALAVVLCGGCPRARPRAKAARRGATVQPMKTGATNPKLPVVYRREYNITLFGLQKLHPFDSEKYGRVVRALVKDRVLRQDELFKPEPVSEELLRQHLTPEYRRRLTDKRTIAKITEMPPLAILPRGLVESRLLMPMRYAAGGTVVAARLALRRGWAINLGGGYHHASLDTGGGFCVYPDITLAVRAVRAEPTPAKKVMIIDLDAHQGNGHGRDLGQDRDVFILDIYNHAIYPGDESAKRGIDLDHDAPPGTGEYLALLGHALRQAFKKFSPDLVIYNAGTDILAGDPLGGLKISPEGVVKRDEMVFSSALGAGVPVVMLLSGGYQDSNAAVIARSIKNLFAKFSLRTRRGPGPS